MPAIRGKRGRPRRKPEIAMGDRAYGTASNIAACEKRGIQPMLAKPRTENGSGLGVIRYVVERLLAWFGNFRRLKLCYERNGKHLQAFHDLAAALICAKKLGWA
jgi:transposase